MFWYVIVRKLQHLCTGFYPQPEIKYKSKGKQGFVVWKLTLNYADWKHIIWLLWHWVSKLYVIYCEELQICLPRTLMIVSGCIEVHCNPQVSHFVSVLNAVGSVTVRSGMRKILCIFAESIWQTWLISTALNTTLHHLSGRLQIWKRAGFFSVTLRKDNLSATESTSYVCSLSIDW